jgi:hypothetical protein
MNFERYSQGAFRFCQIDGAQSQSQNQNQNFRQTLQNEEEGLL